MSVHIIDDVKKQDLDEIEEQKQKIERLDEEIADQKQKIAEQNQNIKRMQEQIMNKQKKVQRFEKHKGCVCVHV